MGEKPEHTDVCEDFEGERNAEITSFGAFFYASMLA